MKCLVLSDSTDGLALCPHVGGSYGTMARKSNKTLDRLGPDKGSSLAQLMSKKGKVGLLKSCMNHSNIFKFYVTMYKKIDQWMFQRVWLRVLQTEAYRICMDRLYVSYRFFISLCV